MHFTCRVVVIQSSDGEIRLNTYINQPGYNWGLTTDKWTLRVS